MTLRGEEFTLICKGFEEWYGEQIEAIDRLVERANNGDYRIEFYDIQKLKLR